MDGDISKCFKLPRPPHAQSLHVRSSKVHPRGTDVGSWIRTFHNIVDFTFDCNLRPGDDVSLAPLFGFSPAVRSLSMSYTSFEVFDLICSFPLLEDPALINLCPESDTVGRSTLPTSPKLTGSLGLGASRGICSTTRRLLISRVASASSISRYYASVKTSGQ